ncbi:hypothetical protein O181_115415 [Austropuccinia psidii MF-1]|uniref:Uncharacterized protein n=1 Tax=Austropuccinia psidii MF-1 TaxID=1389203 RepID=A0A9Q3K6F2_9BASI|nr:hypothetical protein [Austropuccinia psidii MF-1]
MVWDFIWDPGRVRDQVGGWSWKNPRGPGLLPIQFFFEKIKNLSPKPALTMSPSPARRNKETPPLYKEMIQNTKKTRCEIESGSDIDVEMETDETLDYSKKIMSMIDNIIIRLNKIEKGKTMINRD